jgi:hypothetical protein
MALIEKTIAIASVEGMQSDGTIIVDISVDDFISNIDVDEKKQLIEWVNGTAPKISFKGSNVVPFDELPKAETPGMHKLTNKEVKAIHKKGLKPINKQ